MGLCLLSGISLSYKGSSDILIIIPSAVPINPGFRVNIFVLLKVFVTIFGVVFVNLLSGTNSAKNGGFICPRPM